MEIDEIPSIGAFWEVELELISENSFAELSFRCSTSTPLWRRESAEFPVLNLDPRKLNNSHDYVLHKQYFNCIFLKTAILKSRFLPPLPEEYGNGSFGIRFNDHATATLCLNHKLKSPVG